jgi:creatinine amidohydrolase
VELAGATWPQVEATGGRSVLAVPLGSLEQHGPHLPLDTDTRIAVAVASGLAARRREVAVAPAVAYGASG